MISFDGAVEGDACAEADGVSVLPVPVEELGDAFVEGLV